MTGQRANCSLHEGGEGGILSPCRFWRLGTTTPLMHKALLRNGLRARRMVPRHCNNGPRIAKGPLPMCTKRAQIRLASRPRSTAARRDAGSPCGPGTPTGLMIKNRDNCRFLRPPHVAFTACHAAARVPDVGRFGLLIRRSRCLAMATYFALSSKPKELRPSFLHAAAVVPEPMNGSSTRSPGLELTLTSNSIAESGFSVG